MPKKTMSIFFPSTFLKQCIELTLFDNSVMIKNNLSSFNVPNEGYICND